jgi:hypothetical protein
VLASARDSVARLRRCAREQSTACGFHDLPAVRTACADATGGRGLALVEALSDSWGTDVQAGGKTVWFELPG